APCSETELAVMCCRPVPLWLIPAPPPLRVALPPLIVTDAALIVCVLAGRLVVMNAPLVVAVPEPPVSVIAVPALPMIVCDPAPFRLMPAPLSVPLGPPVRVRLPPADRSNSWFAPLL